LPGCTRALIGQFAGPDIGPGEVVIGIKTDRGLWVTALRAAGYTVYAINPRRSGSWTLPPPTSCGFSRRGRADPSGPASSTDSVRA
jgi:hypothetical protein